MLLFRTAAQQDICTSRYVDMARDCGRCLTIRVPHGSREPIKLRVCVHVLCVLSMSPFADRGYIPDLYKINSASTRVRRAIANKKLQLSVGD